MRLSHSAVAISFSLACLLGAAAAEPPAKPAADASISTQPQKNGEAAVKSRREEPVQNSSQFHSKLLEIARDYETFGRVDDEYRWAPWLCRTPSPSVARFSASADESSHGRKLYFLFAKDRGGYVKVGATTPPKEPRTAKLPAANPVAAAQAEAKTAEVGQVIVKESWTPKEVEASNEKALEGRVATIIKPAKKAAGETDTGSRDAMLPYARREGKLYHAAEKGALFIMLKLDPATPDTDSGWVYGTVTTDGKKVTSAGKVTSCMDCHRDAPHDRQFGLQRGRE